MIVKWLLQIYIVSSKHNSIIIIILLGHYTVLFMRSLVISGRSKGMKVNGPERTALTHSGDNLHQSGGSWTIVDGLSSTFRLIGQSELLQGEKQMVF